MTSADDDSSPCGLGLHSQEPSSCAKMKTWKECAAELQTGTWPLSILVVGAGEQGGGDVVKLRTTSSSPGS